MNFAPDIRRRRPSLTPMIDVVFLLLVFFMLAARFGADMAIPISGGAQGSASDPWQGPPRLLVLEAGGMTLNGVRIEDPAAALMPLMPTPDAPVLLRAADGVDLQALTDVLDLLRSGGISSVLLVE